MVGFTALHSNHGIKISFCVTCKDRGHHARVTLEENLKQIRGHNNREIVFLDYNSGDGIGEYIKEHFKEDIEKGHLLYVHHPHAERFHPGKAKNMCHRAAGELGKFSSVLKKHILCNVDADNFIPEGFSEYIENYFSKPKASFLCVDSVMANLNGEKLGWIEDGTAGRLAFRKSDFYNLTGYNESSKEGGWGIDDWLLIRRAAVSMRQLPEVIERVFLKSIPHSNEERLKYLEGTDMYDASKKHVQDVPSTNIVIKYATVIRNELRFIGQKLIPNSNGFGEGEVFVGIDGKRRELGEIPNRIKKGIETVFSDWVGALKNTPLVTQGREN